MHLRVHFFMCIRIDMATQKTIWVAFLAAVLTLPLMIFYHYPPNASIFADALSLILWAMVGIAMLFAFEDSNNSIDKNSSFFFAKKVGNSRYGMFTFHKLFMAPSSVNFILAAAIFCWAVQVRQAQYGFLSVVLTTCAAAISAWAVFSMGMRWAQKKTIDRGAFFSLALLWMGVLVSCLGWFQYFAPEGYWPWISPLETPGRIFANMRQPNHLALVLIWAIWGIIWHSTRNGVLTRMGLGALVFVTPVLAMTGSRMGQALLGMLLILSWASPEWKPRLKASLFTAAIYACAWILMGFFARNGGQPFFGLRGALTSSTGGRYELWGQVLHVLGQTPWYGCGIGQFNFCWTHAVLGERVPGSVVNAHNLFLNGLIEWGWPLTLIIGFWFAVGLGLFIKYGRRTEATLPAGIFFASLIHAMLEYPWWYSYLLLPTMFALGWMWSLSYIEYRLKVNLESGLGQSNPNGNALVITKLRGLLPSILLLFFGGLYVVQYLPLRFIFASGYVKSMNVQELREISEKAALFSMPLSYAFVIRLSESVTVENSTSMISYLKLAGRGTNDPQFLSRFAIVSALAQENKMAQHLAWRAIQSDPEQQGKLIATVEKMNAPELSRFAAYLRNPVEVNLDQSIFLR
jgi:O-Antigen ligase/Virulence factor membrane-bound polymerase, C-terminal